MFQLIVSIIAIALVAVLAAASIFYGGDAFTSGTAKANASAAVNAAQQVAGAWQLYRNQFSANPPSIDVAPNGLADLVAYQFLQGVPSLPNSITGLMASADIDPGAPTTPGVKMTTTSADVCKSVNKASKNDPTAWPSFDATVNYGCYGAGPYTIYYKR